MAERDPSQRIVVTGMGMVSPLGLDVRSSWENLTAGRHGIRNIRDTILAGVPAATVRPGVAATVEGFSLKDNPLFANREQIRKGHRWHRSAQLTVWAAQEAMAQAGLTQGLSLDTSVLPAERFGVSIGSGIAGAAGLSDIGDKLDVVSGRIAAAKKAAEDADEEFVLTEAFDEKDLESRVKPTEILHSLPGRPAEVASMVFGPAMKGSEGKEYQDEPIAFLAAEFAECATGNANIINAADQIRLGVADVVLAGGAEAAINPITIEAFSATRAVDGNPDPNFASRPFDRAAAGLVFGEGAGILVLESLEHARRRGAVIIAELVGYARSGDAFEDTEPSGYGAAAAVKRALDYGSIDPAEVLSYVNAHGTSTAGGLNTESAGYKPGGDGIETRAIAKHFRPEKAYVQSTKGATGHTFGAAGAIEAIFSILAVKEGLMPPSLKLVDPIEEVTDFYGSQWASRMSPGAGQRVPFDVGVNNSFGFGGNNAITIWKKPS